MNSIRSIYKKQSDNQEQLTRKRILTKYLYRLFDQKFAHYFNGIVPTDENGMPMIPLQVKDELVQVLVEQVLTGQIDSDDGASERAIADLIEKYGLKKEP